MRNPSKNNKQWAADFLPRQPFQALQAVFQDKDPSNIDNELNAWFFLCVSHEGAAYYEHEEREDLAILIFDLLRLSAAIYLILRFKEKAPKKPTAEFTFKSFSRTIQAFQLYRLKQSEIENPFAAITDFVKAYSRSYVRLELWDFYDGVRSYSGPLLNKIFLYDTQNMWLLLHCVTEAAYAITSDSYEDLNGETQAALK